MPKDMSRDDEEIIDLTELIESGDEQAAPAPRAASQKASPSIDDGFEALLAQSDAGDGGRPASSKVVDPNEQLDMDMGSIDNLLESLDIPSQPRTAAPAPEKPAEQAQTAAPPEPSADLDSVLDDLLGAAPAPQKAPEPEPAEKRDSFEAALDAILDEDEEPAEAKLPPKPAVAPEPAKAARMPAGKQEPDLDADLDDLLSSFDESPAPKQAAAPAAPKPAVPKPARDTQPDLDADLDDILSSVDTPAPAAPAPGPKLEAPRAAAPVDDFDLPPDLDDMLAEPDRTARKAEASGAISKPFQASGGLKQEAMPETPEFLSMDPRADAPQAAGQPVQPQAYQQEAMAGICRDMLSAQATGTREAIQDFSMRLGAQSAHIEDIGRQATELGKRLFACESKLAAARARIASLEKSVESSAAMEDLLKDGTQLHAGFTALIASAVAQTLKSFMENRRFDPDTIMERLNSLDGRDNNAAARLDALEKRLDDMEPDFSRQLEKTAATVVANILHEEIGKLVSGC